VKGDPIDGRADVYGAGVTLFFLLTGQYPFSASTNMAMLTKKIHQDPPDPRTVAPERQISEGLAAVTLRALERDPSKRFPTAAAFASALVETRREVRMSVQVRRSFSSGVVWCRQCGDLNELGRKFCGECGAKLATSPEEQRPTGGVPRSSVAGVAARGGCGLGPASPSGARGRARLSSSTIAHGSATRCIPSVLA
jgi:serine/threonine-protein kinase